MWHNSDSDGAKYVSKEFTCDKLVYKTEGYSWRHGVVIFLDPSN